MLLSNQINAVIRCLPLKLSHDFVGLQTVKRLRNVTSIPLEQYSYVAPNLLHRVGRWLPNDVSLDL